MRRPVRLLCACLLLLGLALRVADLHGHDSLAHAADCGFCRVAHTPLADVPRCETVSIEPAPEAGRLQLPSAGIPCEEARRDAHRLRAPPVA